MFDSKNILLYPVSLIYGLVTRIRNFFYDSGIFASASFDIPVICVGNITIGGTGKTPHTEYLISILKDQYKVAVLSRGYKRKTKGFLFGGPTSAASDIGDEPFQILQKFPDITLAVDGNRVNGIKKILELKPETQVIILDDGFQHRRLNPGFSILLSDFGRPMTKDHLIPYGSLRETINSMRRADVILITKTPPLISPIQRRIIVKEIDKQPCQDLYFTSLKYLKSRSVFGSNPIETDQLFSECGIVLITGIADPAPLLEHLRSVPEIIHLKFPDHHNFDENDIAAFQSAFEKLKSAEKYLVTTEKDAVRLKEFTNIAENLKRAFYYIPVGIFFLNDDKEEFDNLITGYVRKNNRNNRIPEKERNCKS